MPGYRKKKKTQKKKKNKLQNPYALRRPRVRASIKMRTNALGKAKSTPTLRRTRSRTRGQTRSRGRSKVGLRKVRSVPTKRSILSSTRKNRAYSKAQSFFPRVMEDPELEMRYLKEKRKKDDTIYTVDKVPLKGLKKLRDKGKIRIENLAGILEHQENPVEPVKLEELPHMQGKIDIFGNDDPDAILGKLDCVDRINYCFKTDPNLWKKCREEDIYDRYILPCKMNTIIEKKIKEICGINNKSNLQSDQFNPIMAELSSEFPCLMEQNIVSFLKRYLSYGNEDKTTLEYRVYFQVKRNMFSEISDIDELVQLEMETWGKIWKEDEFLDAVNNFIGVERMKEIIERWSSTPQYDLGEEEATEVYQKMISGQRTFIEGSLTWWTTMLNCPYVIPFIPESDTVDNRILQFLFRMEDSFLEIFDGTQFQMIENSWFVYGEGELNTPDFIRDDTYRNWYIDTYGKQPKVKEVLRWLKHGRTRSDGVEKLIAMKNTFVRLGSSRFRRTRLMPAAAEVDMYRYFEEFIDLLNFSTIGIYMASLEQGLNDGSAYGGNQRLTEIEMELRDFQFLRYQQDLARTTST